MLANHHSPALEAQLGAPAAAAVMAGIRWLDFGLTGNGGRGVTSATRVGTETPGAEYLSHLLAARIKELGW